VGLGELQGGGGTYLAPAVGIPPQFALGPPSFDLAHRRRGLH